MTDISSPMYWVVNLAVAFSATFSFSIIFHTPRKQYIFCGLTGAFGNTVFFACLAFNLDIYTASFIATVALSSMARYFSYHRKEPVTPFLICGIFPLVPGAGLYSAGYYLFISENLLAAFKALEAVKIAAAIAIGIGITLSLPQFIYTFKRAPRKE